MLKARNRLVALVDHIPEVRNMIKTGKGAKRERENMRIFITLLPYFPTSLKKNKT